MRISEHDLIEPLLLALSESRDGFISTKEAREELEKRLVPSGDDLEELPSRPDRSFDQKVRNLKSHRKSKGNPIGEGLVEDVPGGFRITDAGRREAKTGIA